MPPKVDKEAAKAPPVASEPEPSEAEKDLVENELVLNYVKSRLGRYQQSEERLFVENVRLENALRTQEKDFGDIREYLQLQDATKTKRVEALEGQNAELEEKLRQAVREHEVTEEGLRNENASLKNELQKKIQEFNKKIKGSQDFLEQKERLEEELNGLRTSTDEKVRHLETKLADMERRHIQDKEMWKRNTAQKIKEAKAQMLQLTDNQLEMTTKRTILENEQMASELGYQSRQTEKMLHRNEILLDQNTDIKIQMELAKETQNELAQRNLTYQRAMQKLLNKLVEERRLRQRGREEAVCLEEELQEEKETRTVMELRLEDQVETMEGLNRQVAELKIDLQAMKDARDETVRFLEQCMEDVKTKTVAIIADQKGRKITTEPIVVPGRLQDLDAAQRERALKYLLQKLKITDTTECASQELSTESGSRGVPHTASSGNTLPDVIIMADRNARSKRIFQ